MGVNPIFNRKAEEAVIGSVLINPDAYYTVEFLKPEHFHIHRHQWAWASICRLMEACTPIDLLTVADDLERHGKLAEVGGSAQLTAFVSQVENSLNVGSYARIVEGDAIRRKMLVAAERIAALASDQQKPVSEALADAEGLVAGLELASDGRSATHLAELLIDTIADTRARSEAPRAVWGLSTGLPKLDRETGGFHPGEIVYLAGPPNVGKTWCALGWAIALGSQAPGMFVSLEMRKEAIARRLLSGMSKVPTRDLKTGFVRDEQFTLLNDAVQKSEQHNVFIEDGNCDTQKLATMLRWARREHGIRWFILDYALLLQDPGDEIEKSSNISANMKRIVNELGLAGVVLHSVVKTGMGGEEPRMSDQRGSGQAIHDADVQLFLTKVSDNDDAARSVLPEHRKRMATLYCTKGRELEDPNFKITLVRQGQSPFFGEYADEPRY